VESASLSGNGQLVSNPTGASGAPYNFTGHGVLASSPKAYAKFSEAAAPHGAGHLSATALSTEFVESASLSGNGQLVSNPTGASGAPYNFTGHGVLSAPVYTTLGAALSGHGVLTTTPAGAAGAPAAFIGAGQLSAPIKVKLKVDLSGQGILGPDPHGGNGGAHTTGHGVLSAPIKVKINGFFTGTGVLTPTPSGAAGAPAAFIGAGHLSATDVPTIPAYLPGDGELSATAPAFGGVSLFGNGVLTGNVESGVQRNALLKGKGQLSATVAATKFILTAAPHGTGHLSSSQTYAKFLISPALHGTGTLTVRAYSTNTYGKGTLSATELAIVPTHPQPHGHLTLATNPAGYAIYFTFTFTFVGTGTLTQTNYQIFYSTAAPSGVGMLVSTAKSTKFFEAPMITGHGVLAATTMQRFSVNAPNTGNGQLSATATALFSRSSSTTGHGVLSARTVLQYVRTSAPHGAGQLSAQVYAKFSEAAALTGHGALATVSKVSSNPHITGHGVLSATAQGGRFLVFPHLTGVGTLAGRVTVRAANVLTFFPVAGTFYAAQSGSTQPEPVNALVTFTPRLPKGELLFIDSFVVSNPTDATQTVNLLGGPNGGTFTLSYAGDTTAPIAYNAAPGDVQAALQALPSIGSGNVSVGTSLFPQAYTVTFTGALANMAVSAISGDGRLLFNVFGAGFCAVSVTVSNVGSNHFVADSAIALPPLTARIWDGVLSTIDYADTPGFQLASSTALLNLEGGIIYDVTFSKITFNEANQDIAPFAFAAPADNTPVDLSSPDLVKLPYQPPSDIVWVPEDPDGDPDDLFMTGPTTWRQRAQRRTLQTCGAVSLTNRVRERGGRL
jgi:hypothetical protein